MGTLSRSARRSFEATPAVPRRPRSTEMRGPTEASASSSNLDEQRTRRVDLVRGLGERVIQDPERDEMVRQDRLRRADHLGAQPDPDHVENQVDRRDPRHPPMTRRQPREREHRRAEDRERRPDVDRVMETGAGIDLLRLVLPHRATVW